MGQAIVYCTGCNAQLRDADFTRGAAFRIEHIVYCRNCVPSNFVPPQEPRPQAPRRQNVSTASTLPVLRPEAPGPSPALLWGGGIATGVVVVLIGLVMYSRDPGRPAATAPAPELEARKSAPPPPEVSPAEADARAALARLLKQIDAAPTDLDRQQSLLEELARRAPGTSVAPEVDRQFARMAQRRQERREAELAELQRQAQASREDQATILLRAARGRYSDRSWTDAIDRLLAPVEPTRAPAQPVQAAAAPAVAAPVPARLAPPVKARAPAEAPPFPAGWEAGMALATGRDYTAAQTALENSPDLPLLRAVAALQRDSLQALSKTPRGQRIALGTVEGTFVRENGGIIELKTEAGPVEIETGEIAPSALVALARAAGPVDTKAAATFCLIEGDTAGARALIGADASALPERFWAYADKVSRAPPEPAREVYQAASALLAKPATAADGVVKLQSLLRDRADDSFVRRNRTAIQTRSQAGREFVFLAEDLKPSGLFHPARAGKLESCWTCESDVEPAKQKDTFLDFEFSTTPDTPYRAWALVGGCCQEVFDFSCQGTEMEAGRGTKEPAEPGSNIAVPVKPYLPNVKKTHAQHNGPKQPSRWEWTPLPLPRYAKPGVQRIRIFSDQKGFSVAAILVSASRSGPPSDPELKELVRGRGERPKAAPQAKTIPLLTCALDGSERHLVGNLRDRAIYGVPLYGQCYTGVERSEALVFPESGELRFTYFLKSPSDLIARFRLNRDGKTLAFDVSIPSAVVGTPTEVRLPLASFQQAYVNNGPHLVPGDTTNMIYVYGSPECGLRLDALSVVEFRK